MMMRTSNIFLKTAFLFTAVALASCSSDDIAQSGKQDGSNSNVVANTTTFTGEYMPPTHTSEDVKAQLQAPATRTSITHTIGEGATAFWSAGDKVWIQDNNGDWQHSEAGELNTDLTRGTFSVSGLFSNGCTVRYTGDNGTSNTVTIAAEQTQSAANDFSHAGKSGDCGVGTASGSGNSFKFTLTHKASYLCFLPRTSEFFIPRSKLTKIEVIAKDDIAGVYKFTNGTLSEAPTSNGSKTITLTMGGSEDFVVDNKKTDINKSAYIVIAPGKHTLIVRYWFKNTKNNDNPTGNVEGTVTKYIENLNCEPGKICDITANLTLEDFAKNGYYMWDAGLAYWHGQSYWQPTINDEYNEKYPKDHSSPRWYNTPSNHWAEQTAKDCANVNQMAWLVMKGAPHWDNELWTLMGHLYAGRMWIKRLGTIGKENGTTSDAMQYKAPDNVDYRSVTGYHDEVINRKISHDPLFKDEISDYFYLAPLGGYYKGKASSIGEGCNYWSKTRTLHFGGNDIAWGFGVNKTRISVNFNKREYGFPMFKDFK